MNLFRKRLITSVLAFGLIGGAIIGALLYYAFPAYFASNWFVIILIFFLVVKPLIVAYVESASSKVNDRKLLNTYLLIMMVQMLLALFIILIYSVIDKEGVKSFALTFMSLYLLFLGIESWSFVKIEKHLKENKSK